MNTKLLTILIIAGAMAISVVSGGCQKALSSADVTVSDGGGASETVAASPEALEKAGALLWSQNCMRCHNFRNPRERSDREWNIIVHHMRVRGNLTAQEHRLILAFLQSAN